MHTARSTTLPSIGREANLASVRSGALGILAMLGIEFALGMAANLYTHLAPGGESFGHALAHAGATFDAHVALGVLVVLGSLHVLARALATQLRPVMVASATGSLSLVGAFGSGMAFVGNADAAASLAMALLTALAVASYVGCLQLLNRSIAR